MCVFNGVFMRLGPDFSRFGHKDVSCRVRNRMLDKIVFKHSHVFFCLFFLGRGYLQLTVNSQKTLKWLFTVDCQ